MNMTDLQPKEVWKNFALLNAIPRPSKKEQKVIAFMKKWGEDLGLPTSVDKTGNVIIRKPATKGMENRKPVVLQGHLDMVCQKNNDTKFDFDTQGIQTQVDGDWVKAKGTTLGADNGLGVSSIMAILESKDLPHPDIEALFTIDEETGMTGAFGLQPGVLKGEILLNLDTENDTEIDIGCAGGMDVTAVKKYATEKRSGTQITIVVKGLQGGHSGMDIDKGRGNANVLLTRFLYLATRYEIQLATIDGGGLRNAIPREAKAVFVIKEESEFLKAAESLKNHIQNEYKSIEKDLEITITHDKGEQEVLSELDSRMLINALKAAHNGVYRMSPDVEGLVESSNNIARLILEKGVFEAMCLSRSSVESTKTTVIEQLRACFEMAGMDVSFTGGYPGWQPDPNSSILKVLQDVYQKRFKEEPEVIACHAGLECGIIGANYPKMELISFGPTILGAHSPEERANIKSVQKFWGFLKQVLEEIPNR